MMSFGKEENILLSIAGNVIALKTQEELQYYLLTISTAVLLDQYL